MTVRIMPDLPIQQADTQQTATATKPRQIQVKTAICKQTGRPFNECQTMWDGCPC